VLHRLAITSMTTATARPILAIANSFLVKEPTTRLRDWWLGPADRSASRRAVLADLSQRALRSYLAVPCHQRRVDVRLYSARGEPPELVVAWLSLAGARALVEVVRQTRNPWRR
jgi:hypothetical protein